MLRGAFCVGKWTGHQIWGLRSVRGRGCVSAFASLNLLHAFLPRICHCGVFKMHVLSPRPKWERMASKPWDWEVEEHGEEVRHAFTRGSDCVWMCESHRKREEEGDKEDRPQRSWEYDWNVLILIKNLRFCTSHCGRKWTNKGGAVWIGSVAPDLQTLLLQEIYMLFVFMTHACVCLLPGRINMSARHTLLHLHLLFCTMPSSQLWSSSWFSSMVFSGSNYVDNNRTVYRYNVLFCCNISMLFSSTAYSYWTVICVISVHVSVVVDETFPF